MQRNNCVNRLFTVISCSIFGFTACSTMRLENYPEPPINSFANARSINGVSSVAQPLLDEKKGKEYFGVKLLQKGILAVYLLVKNNNPNTSFTIPAEFIYISQTKTNGLANNNPEGNSQEVGKATAVVGALFISPLFLAVGAQQLSDASIIKENFEAKRFRSKTIDPGQTASGFSYFNWEDFKELDAIDVCFKFIDPMADKSFILCQKTSLRE